MENGEAITNKFRPVGAGELTWPRRGDTVGIAFRKAAENAKAVLKPGDVVRVQIGTRPKRTFTFARWDDEWMTSTSGRTKYTAAFVDQVNGKPVDFNPVVNA